MITLVLASFLNSTTGLAFRMIAIMWALCLGVQREFNNFITNLAHRMTAFILTIFLSFATGLTLRMVAFEQTLFQNFTTGWTHRMFTIERAFILKL